MRAVSNCKLISKYKLRLCTFHYEKMQSLFLDKKNVEKAVGADQILLKIIQIKI